MNSKHRPATSVTVRTPPRLATANDFPEIKRGEYLVMLAKQDGKQRLLHLIPADLHSNRVEGQYRSNKLGVFTLQSASQIVKAAHLKNADGFHHDGAHTYVKEVMVPSEWRLQWDRYWHKVRIYCNGVVDG